MDHQFEHHSFRENILATDLLKDQDKLTEKSKAIIAKVDDILDLWKTYVRQRIAKANNVPDPILTNTIPAFIVNFAEVLSPNYPRRNVNESNTLSFEHGGERARLTVYTPESLIIEYKCLRRAFFNILSKAHIELSEDEAENIHSAIDDAMTNAAMGFSLVKTEIKEQFVATLTHDLRNPLNAASIAADMILRNPTNPKVVTYAQRIKDNHRRIDQMIGQLLDSLTLKYGQKLFLKLSYCDIYTITQELLVEFKAQQGDRFELVGEKTEGYWDQEALKRTLENLLSNAIKYGNPGTKITVNIIAKDGRMILRVHNWGPPIPANEQETIFQIYRRALKAKRENKKGWGLGLAFVRGVAEAHGGSVGLDSDFKRGTTFTLDIPVDARPFQDSPSLMEG